MTTFQDEYIKWVANHYDANHARIIIDRFNNEFQKTRIRVGGINFKPKELSID
jgi:ribosomal protein S24E